MTEKSPTILDSIGRTPLLPLELRHNGAAYRLYCKAEFMNPTGSVKDRIAYYIIEQAEKFLASGGKIFACGTCLKQRNSPGSNLCPMSTMKDMYRIVAESDKILSF